MKEVKMKRVILLFCLFILAGPSFGQLLDVEPQSIDFTISGADVLTRKVTIRNLSQSTVAFSVLYKPLMLEIEGLESSLFPDESMDITIILKIPYEAWSEAKEIYKKVKEKMKKIEEEEFDRLSKEEKVGMERRLKKMRRRPSWSLHSKISIVMRDLFSGGEEVIEIPLKANFVFEEKKVGEMLPPDVEAEMRGY